MTLPYTTPLTGQELDAIIAASGIFEHAARFERALYRRPRTWRWEPWEGQWQYGGWYYRGPLPMISVNAVRSGEDERTDWMLSDGGLRFASRPARWLEAEVIAGYGTSASIGTSSGRMAAAASVLPAGVSAPTDAGAVVFAGAELMYFDGQHWQRGQDGTAAAEHAVGTEFARLRLPLDVQEAVQTIAAKWRTQRQKAGEAVRPGEVGFDPSFAPSLMAGVQRSVVDRYRSYE